MAVPSSTTEEGPRDAAAAPQANDACLPAAAQRKIEGLEERDGSSGQRRDVGQARGGCRGEMVRGTSEGNEWRLRTVPSEYVTHTHTHTHTPAGHTNGRVDELFASSWATGFAYYGKTDVDRHMATDDTRRSFVTTYRHDFGVHMNIEIARAESYKTPASAV